MHKQVAVKVNGLCDKGIQPLVSTLNEIDDLITLDSCESDADGKAYVSFEYRGTWHKLASLVQAMSNELRIRLADYDHSFRLEWFDGNERPRAQIVMDSEHVSALAGHLQALVTQLAGHMNPADFANRTIESLTPSAGEVDVEDIDEAGNIGEDVELSDHDMEYLACMNSSAHSVTVAGSALVPDGDDTSLSASDEDVAEVEVSATEKKEMALSNWMTCLERLPDSDALPTSATGWSEMAQEILAKAKKQQSHLPDTIEVGVTAGELSVREIPV